MSGVPVNVTLPRPLAAAVDAEAHRRLCRRGDVLRDFMVQCWPQYVSALLTKDFREVIDAEVVDDDLTPDAERPGLPTPARSNALTYTMVDPHPSRVGRERADGPGGTT